MSIMESNNRYKHKEGEVVKFGELKLLSINVNSIVANNRRYNLLNVLQKLKIDIALLSETKLKDRHKINFPNYNIIRDDRPKGSGGGLPQ